MHNNWAQTPHRAAIKLKLKVGHLILGNKAALSTIKLSLIPILKIVII